MSDRKQFTASSFLESLIKLKKFENKLGTPAIQVTCFLRSTVDR